MKNSYVKSFLHRGLIFGGFGPMVTGIIYLILSFVFEDISVSGKDMFVIILSTYLLAFVHAGASVFNQIEHWGIAKSMLCHFFVLYVAYTVCYLINAWIPFDAVVFAIYTAIFVAAYLVVWITVYLCVRYTEKRLNEKLKIKN